MQDMLPQGKIGDLSASRCFGGAVGGGLRSGSEYGGNSQARLLLLFANSFAPDKGYSSIHPFGVESL
jgi:hypothetical protein